MPSITQLKYVWALYREGHFGEAAQACDVSQPTLSTQIQKAEAALGVVLFDRSTKPISATPQGEILLPEVGKVLSAHERLVWMAEGKSEALSGKFSLGVIPTLAPYVVPWFLRSFSHTHPELELSIHERPTEVIIEDLQHGRLDAGLLATPLEEGAIHEDVLFYDPFYFYGHPESPFLKSPTVDVASLNAGDLWLLEDGHCLRNQVTSFCGLSRQHSGLGSVTFAAGSLETLRNLIDSSGGYTLVPETYARTLPKDVRRAQVRAIGPMTPTREIGLVSMEGGWKRHVVEALRDSILQEVPRALKQVGPQGEVLPVR